MKTFKDFLTEADNSIPKNGNYYKIGGDRYDGGSVLTVYVKGKKVSHQILDGDADFEYKGKKYGKLDDALDAIAKDNGLSSNKDFKRVEMK